MQKYLEEIVDLEKEMNTYSNNKANILNPNKWDHFN